MRALPLWPRLNLVPSKDLVFKTATPGARIQQEISGGTQSIAPCFIRLTVFVLCVSGSGPATKCCDLRPGLGCCGTMAVCAGGCASDAPGLLGRVERGKPVS